MGRYLTFFATTKKYLLFAAVLTAALAVIVYNTIIGKIPPSSVACAGVYPVVLLLVKKGMGAFI